MSTHKLSFFVLTISIFFQMGLASCNETSIDLLSGEIPSLTAEEQANLLLLREEEKLARDVYTYLYDQYGINIFANIASSEQKHMNAVLEILNKYNITDPAISEFGVFTNSTLQQLYDQLTAQGDQSLLQALVVGATIEDLDIRDLDNMINTTDKSDISILYEMLRCGSGNHLRAFIGQIESRGGIYTAQYLSLDRYTEVINGTHQSCGN